MEQMDDTTPDMEANAEDYAPDFNSPYVNVKEYSDTGVNMMPALPAVQYVSLSSKSMGYELYCVVHASFSMFTTSFTDCLKYLYILAFTSGIKYAGSDDLHKIEVRAAGQTRIITLPAQPGYNYLENKGDLWKLTFDDDFHFTKCVTLNNIDRIVVRAGGNDGWNIDSIVTYVGAPGKGFRDATIDFNVFRWVDGNGAPSNTYFMLKKIH